MAKRGQNICHAFPLHVGNIDDGLPHNMCEPFFSFRDEKTPELPTKKNVLPGRINPYQWTLPPNGCDTFLRLLFNHTTFVVRPMLAYSNVGIQA